MEMRRLYLAIMLVSAWAATLSAPAMAQESTANDPTNIRLLADNAVSIPSAPSVVGSTEAIDTSSAWSTQAPHAAIRLGVGNEVTSRSFLVVTSVLFASTIANVELTSSCMRPYDHNPGGECREVPDALRSRSRLYAVSVPADGTRGSPPLRCETSRRARRV